MYKYSKKASSTGLIANEEQYYFFTLFIFFKVNYPCYQFV